MNSLTIILFALLILVLLLRYPEVCLALFLFSGTFKTEISQLSPWLPDITVTLALILLAGILFNYLKEPSFRNRLILRYRTFGLTFALILLFMTMSAIHTTAENRYALEKTIRFATLTGLATFAPLFIIQNHRQLFRFLIVSVILGALMTFTGQMTSEGLTAFGANHIATGRIIGLGLLTILGLMLVRSAGAVSLLLAPSSLLYAGLAALLCYGLFASGSRGALVALLVAIATMLLVGSAIKRARKIVLTATLFLIAAVLTITIISPQASATMNQRLATTLAAPLDQTAHTRVIRAQAAMEMFTQRPLTGVGVGGFDLLFNPFESERGDYPHNLFLEVAAEMGIIGLILFTALVFLPIYYALTSFRQTGNWTTLLVLAVTIYLLVNALFSGDLNDNRLLFTALGLCLTRKIPATSPAVQPTPSFIQAPEKNNLPGVVL